jgi:hypothetical protein
MQYFEGEEEIWQQCILCCTDPVPSCPVCAIYITNEIVAVPPAVLAASCANTGHRVCLCVQAEDNQFGFFCIQIYNY